MGIRNALCGPCDKNPQKAIAYAWFTSIVIVVIAFICACAFTAHSGGYGSGALEFSAIWTVLLLIGLSVGGSLVMRKYRTSLAVGFFLGVVMIMSQTMLILFAIFAGRATTTNDSDEPASDRAFAAFCFFLFMVYSTFAGMLAVFREDIILDDTTKYEDDGVPEDASQPPVGV
ncbi:unnamed protein product [Discosporangium mesarthrocarpum]